MKRNLIYYVCPFEDSELEWKLNIGMIAKYIHIFNNRKIITIATGENMAHPSRVLEVMDNAGLNVTDCDIEIQYRENNTRAGEVVPFMEMLYSIQSNDPDEISFYAHAKGVKPIYSGSADVLENIRVWRNAMYYFCLRDINEVETVMKTHTYAGALKRLGGWNGIDWHYSGTFFWFRHDHMFNNAHWQCIRYDWGGVEAYPGYHAKYNKGYQFLGNMYFNPYNDTKDWKKILSKADVDYNFLLCDVIQMG